MQQLSFVNPLLPAKHIRTRAHTQYNLIPATLAFLPFPFYKGRNACSERLTKFVTITQSAVTTMGFKHSSLVLMTPLSTIKPCWEHAGLREFVVNLHVNPYMANIFHSYVVLFISIIKVHTILSGTQTSFFSHQIGQPQTEVGSYNTKHWARVCLSRDGWWAHRTLRCTMEQAGQRTPTGFNHYTCVGLPYLSPPVNNQLFSISYVEIILDKQDGKFRFSEVLGWEI